jgi:signal transduction histidine kinase
VKETIAPELLDSLGEDDEASFGEVSVTYRFEGDMHELAVRDSGPGMGKETIQRILSGTARSQWVNGGGSGWGTKIVLELAATHEAKVTIESMPGEGSTFFVRFPHCP